MKSGLCDFEKIMSELYNSLQDELSKEIFWGRLKYELSPNLDSSINLGIVSKYLDETEENQIIEWRKRIKEISNKKLKLVFGGLGILEKNIQNYLRKKI